MKQSAPPIQPSFGRTNSASWRRVKRLDPDDSGVSVPLEPGSGRPAIVNRRRLCSAPRASLNTLVLADDLSGAAEVAGIAARGGDSVALCAGAPERDPGAAVLVIDTDSRALPPAEAAERVAAITRQAAAWKPRRVFKKIDSVLRGPLCEEINATLDALGRSSAVLVAANPSRGRCVRDGIYYVDDQPLHASAFASDPSQPARESELRALVDHDPRIRTPDARSTADLDAIVAGLEPGELAIGAADFFAAWIDAPPSAPPTPLPAGRQLWICGSPNAASRRHHDFERCRIPFLDPAIHADLSAGEWARRSLQIASPDNLALLVDERTGPDPGPKLAEAATRILARWQPRRVFLEGGATARAFIDGTTWRRFRVESELAAGIVGVRPSGHPEAPILFLKPGSYPWPETALHPEA